MSSLRPDVPPSLEQLTQRMLAKDRAAEAVSRVMIPEALDYPQ